MGLRAEESREAEGGRAGGFRHFDAGERRAVDYLWIARAELLPGGTHRASAGSAFGSFWRRCAESFDDSVRNNFETARQEFPRHGTGILRQCGDAFQARAQGAEFTTVEGKGVSQDGGRARP